MTRADRWDDDPPPRWWRFAGDRLARIPDHAPTEPAAFDDDAEGRLARLDAIAAAHLSRSDRLLYSQVLRSGMSATMVSRGVGVRERAARRQAQDVLRRLRVIALAPPVLTLPDTIDALAGAAWPDDVAAAWMWGDFRGLTRIGRSLPRPQLDLFAGAIPQMRQRAAEAVARGRAAIERHRDTVEAAGLLAVRLDYRDREWVQTRRARAASRLAFDAA